MTTGTVPTGQIRPDKTHVRFYPLWDGIHDGGLDLEANQVDGSHDLGTRDCGHQLHKTSYAIDDLRVATNSGTMPLGDRR